VGEWVQLSQLGLLVEADLLGVKGSKSGCLFTSPPDCTTRSSPSPQPCKIPGREYPGTLDVTSKTQATKAKIDKWV
jgi:hypothetical protein